jgi:transposase-like protein
MSSTKTNSSPDKTSKSSKPRQRTNHHFSATEKAQAVLAVWTERCKAAEVCRQMNITGMSLHQWQQRAMEGMLQALETRVNLARGEALSPRLQSLLLSRAARPRPLNKRLEQIQLASNHQSSAQPS